VVVTEESGARADARRAAYFVRADGAVVIPPGDLAERTYDLWMREVHRQRLMRVGNLRSDLLAVLDALLGAASADGSADMPSSKIRSGKSDDAMFLSTAQVADKLGVSARAVTDLLVKGRLPGRKEGRTWFVAQKDLDKYTGEA
jgi:excisionase family DNA binding protein